MKISKRGSLLGIIFSVFGVSAGLLSAWFGLHGHTTSSWQLGLIFGLGGLLVGVACGAYGYCFNAGNPTNASLTGPHLLSHSE